MTLIMLGPPGSGKDTQAQIFAQKFGFTVISPGEALRESAAQGNQEIARFISEGNLVPDEIVDKVLRDYLQAHGDLEKIILTGIPRRLEQIALIDKMLADLGQQFGKVVYLDIPDAEVVARVSGRLYAPNANHYYHEKFNPPKVAGHDDLTGEKLIRRPDDHPEAVQKRLEVFHNETREVLAAYERRGQLIRVSGLPEIEQVAESVEAALRAANVV